MPRLEIEIPNSRVLKTIKMLQEEYKDQWTGIAPPVAFSVRDIAGAVFSNDLMREIPDPLLMLLVFNEMKDLANQGVLKKVDDPSNYAHFTHGPKAEFYALL
jgi:hypothetical protein